MATSSEDEMNRLNRLVEERRSLERQIDEEVRARANGVCENCRKSAKGLFVFQLMKWMILRDKEHIPEKFIVLCPTCAQAVELFMGIKKG
jgi:hypothetical protein